MGRLDVRVCAARKLPDTQWISKPDPYCKVHLENQTHKTRTIDNTVNPVWDEVFKFVVADENSSQLRVELWKKNHLVSDEFLGVYNLSISGLVKGVVRDGWFLLQQSKTNAELHLRILAVDFGRDATPADLQAAGLSAPVWECAPASIPPPSGLTWVAPQGQGYPPQQQGCPPQQQGYPPQQGFQQGHHHNHHVEVVNAWYGVQGQVEESRGGQVAERLRQVVGQNNGRLVLDGNLNGILGFDPVPGTQKVLAIHVRHNGQDHHLRAFEGQYFQFPN